MIDVPRAVEVIKSDPRRARLLELRAEMERAVRSGEFERAGEIQAEMEALTDE